MTFQRASRIIIITLDGETFILWSVSLSKLKKTTQLWREMCFTIGNSRIWQILWKSVKQTHKHHLLWISFLANRAFSLEHSSFNKLNLDYSVRLVSRSFQTDCVLIESERPLRWLYTGQNVCHWTETFLAPRRESFPVTRCCRAVEFWFTFTQTQHSRLDSSEE